MLKEGHGHYFTVLQVYMTILIQLRQYEKLKKRLKLYSKKTSFLLKARNSFISSLISAAR